MDFYNLFRGLKYFIKSYERFFKFVMLSLLTIVFIILALLMLELKSYCETLDTFEYDNNTYTIGITDTLYDSVSNLTEFNDLEYTMFCFLTEMQLYVQFIPSSLNTVVYLDDISSLSPYGGGWVYFHYTDENNIKDNTNLKWYSLNEGDAQVSGGGTGLANFYNKRTYRGNDYINFYSTMSIYTDSNLNDLIYQAPIPVASYNPLLLNADTTKYGNTLINGKFNYFYINSDGVQNLTFRVIDNTLSTDNVHTFTLISSSSYCYDTTLLKYAVPKSALSFGYNDEHEYDLILSWTESAVPYSITYNVTTDFLSPTIINGVQDDLFSIDYEIQNISGIILNDNFDFTYFNEAFPVFTSSEVPSTVLIDNLFNAIRQAFTDEYIYNELPSIDLPLPGDNVVSIGANYMYHHVPEVIINIIHIVYWFVISRFVLKDVMRTIDRVRQGDYFMGSDQNIKTEVL